MARINKNDLKTGITFTRCSECERIEVVHCKDCEHWGIGVVGETEHVKCCEYGKYMVGENGYCCFADMRKKVE